MPDVEVYTNTVSCCASSVQLHMGTPLPLYHLLSERSQQRNRTYMGLIHYISKRTETRVSKATPDACISFITLKAIVYIPISQVVRLQFRASPVTLVR